MGCGESEAGISHSNAAKKPRALASVSSAATYDKPTVRVEVGPVGGALPRRRYVRFNPIGQNRPVRQKQLKKVYPVSGLGGHK
jgi:hypothetical protein